MTLKGYQPGAPHASHCGYAPLARLESSPKRNGVANGQGETGWALGRMGPGSAGGRRIACSPRFARLAGHKRLLLKLGDDALVVHLDGLRHLRRNAACGFSRLRRRVGYECAVADGASGGKVSLK